MIRGRFGNTSGRPYIEGRVVLPRLSVSGYISFLVDTGSAPTIVMPVDAGRLRIDYNQLTNTTSTLGIGGFNTVFQEPAFAYFVDEAGSPIYGYSLDIRIASVTPHNAKFPSVLGRNIIDHWRLLYDKRNDVLSAEVGYAATRIPVSGGPGTAGGP